MARCQEWGGGLSNLLMEVTTVFFLLLLLWDEPLLKSLLELSVRR
jgi:hypothetical protein